MYNKPNPDDRSNNVERLQNAVENTKENMRKAEETMMNAAPAEQQAIREKNARREESIAGMQAEIQDEMNARENGQING
ncbi:small acid-soluble spore protein Tlp [Bacillus sp. B190/17]|uniref:Small, acid-soluble spore protein Tlp n=1 Tax=Bacillus lumedeiriae TaxID=3058829 RepID=A0ABW8I8T1_9BACI